MVHAVLHRIDDLEKWHPSHAGASKVLHRIDDLEIIMIEPAFHNKVLHRIDDLENPPVIYS